MDAVHQCNAQMRIFLALKQPSRLRVVFNKLPYDCVAQANKITDIERSNVIKEYICFKTYLVRFIHYHRRDTHTPEVYTGLNFMSGYRSGFEISAPGLCLNFSPCPDIRIDFLYTSGAAPRVVLSSPGLSIQPVVRRFKREACVC